MWVYDILATGLSVMLRELQKEVLSSDLVDRETCGGCNPLDSEKGQADIGSLRNYELTQLTQEPGSALL